MSSKYPRKPKPTRKQLESMSDEELLRLAPDKTLRKIKDSPPVEDTYYVKYKNKPQSTELDKLKNEVNASWVGSATMGTNVIPSAANK